MIADHHREDIEPDKSDLDIEHDEIADAAERIVDENYHPFPDRSDDEIIKDILKSLPKGEWNVIPPYGETGPCLDRLFVPIRVTEESAITAALDAVLSHLARCQVTRLIQISLIGYPSLNFTRAAAWHDFRRSVHQQHPTVQVRVAAQRQPRLAFFLESGRPAGGRDIRAAFNALNYSGRRLLRRRVRAFRQLGIETSQDCCLIDEYTGQPRGMNGRPTVTFGTFSNQQINNWRGRICLVNQPGLRLPISFPIESYPFGTAPLAVLGEGYWGNRRPANWRLVQTHDGPDEVHPSGTFESAPERFVTRPDED